MQKLRKAFTISIMIMTVLSLSVVVAPDASAAAQAGDLIKMDGLSSVYYLGADGKRYVFPNEATYFSWYTGFDGVVTIPQSELESYPLGSNVTVRPGTKLVKITTNPKVYAVTPDGVLVAIPDEATALALYGENWAQRVVDVPDAFFTNYTIASSELSADAYPEGSLVKFGEGADIYYIDADGSARAIADEAAFLANRFKWDDVIESTLTLPTTGADITGSEEGLTDTSSGAGGTAGAGTGLTVAISADTPSAGNVPLSSPADMLKVNLTASNDGDVVVNTLTVSLYDLGDWGNVEDVTLYVDGIKISSAKDITSDREAIINIAGGLDIPAGTTESVVVRATITSTDGNYALGLKTASSLNTNGAVVSGSFPIIGNTKTAVTVSVGTVAITGFTADTATEELGKDDVLLADFNLDVAGEDIIWESARIENKDDDGVVDNVKIYIEGDEVADATIDGDFFVFDMGNFVIDEDENVDVEVRGDIGVTDTDDTFNLQIDEANDFSFIGKSFGYAIEMTGAGLTNTGLVVSLEAGELTLDVDKTAQADEVRSDTTNVTLATISLTSNGEDATLEEIASGTTATGFVIETVSGTTDEADLANIELRDLDGGVYDLSSNFFAGSDYWVLYLDEEIALPMGVTKTFELEADIEDSMTNGVELKVTLNDDALVITGDISDAPIDNITPTSVSGDKVTIEDASLGWATEELNNETVVEGATDVLIYTASLEAGDSSDVELKSFMLTSTSSVAGVFADDNISQMVVTLNDEVLETSSGDISGTGVSTTITFNGLDSDYRTIPAGEVYTLRVFANIENNVTTGSFELAIDETDTDVDVEDVDGNDLDNANVIANEDSSSRVVTLVESGNLKVELETNDSRANDDTYLLAGTQTVTDRYLGELVFTSENEDVEVTALNLKAAAATSQATKDDILYVILVDEDGLEVASEAPEIDGDVEFEFASGEFVIPANNAVSYFIAIEAKSIDSESALGTADFNSNAKFYIEDVEASGVESSEEITMNVSADAAIGMGEFDIATSTTATTTIVGAVINSIEEQTFADESLGGYQTIAEFTVVVDNGDNMKDNSALEAALITLDLTLSSSTGVVASEVKAYIEGDSGNMTDATSTVAGVATIDFTSLDGEANLIDGAVTIIVKATLEDTSGSDSSWLQAKINSVSTDFVWNADNVADGSGTDFTGVRLDNDEIIFQKISE